LEKEIEKADFWKDRKRAEEDLKKFNYLKKEIKEIEELKLELEILRENPREKEIEDFEKKLRKKELEVFLSGKYDRGDAILTIQAGAGGEDAQDWAAMLLRMYQRYCQRKGFSFEVLDINYGEPGPEGRIGVKSVVLEIKGNFAFGFLKREAGVHRLVRISPFSAKGLRHTSFALVQVLPKIQKEEINIKPEDLRYEFFKASGPGGQYVNKRMTAVRVYHLPTKITVSCQTERSLAQNKEKALEILASRIYQYLEEKKKMELEKIKGRKVSVEFGSQIRSYVFHPYKLVKDLRTKVETKNVEEVLDGNLDQFIEAEIIKNDKV
jgi:peptide chain release factor 2